MCLNISIAEHCQNPQIISTSYTTQDATILKHVAYIANFYVKCKKGEAGNLYAVLENNITPVASVGEGKYQVSWTEDIKTSKTGDITVNIYDEVGYSSVRKALRAGENLFTVPVFAKIVINHPGVYAGPWFSCEFLAVGFSVVIAYMAIHFRSKLLS
ncbi:unnamed protein product [Acanthoscelides obtectus]|uniref:Translocon-associated protein subunit delta n=1 Tax=Acanthoscelides obtectus TaxID=200917 RepID=A0A9P0PA03_ACAOB|nr:unnamed protein product [Acanthoscelides obtectus]CAK1677232.1 Translocon-associated protein subunit delta [Acanthoscelides obtectus]